LLLFKWVQALNSCLMIAFRSSNTFPAC